MGEDKNVLEHLVDVLNLACGPEPPGSPGPTIEYDFVRRNQILVFPKNTGASRVWRIRVVNLGAGFWVDVMVVMVLQCNVVPCPYIW